MTVWYLYEILMKIKFSQGIPTSCIKCKFTKYNLKQSDPGNAGQVSQVEGKKSERKYFDSIHLLWNMIYY